LNKGPELSRTVLELDFILRESLEWSKTYLPSFDDGPFPKWKTELEKREQDR